MPTCHGQGDVTHVQRSFIGDIRTTQPCPTCHGYGTIIPDPCMECSGDGRVRSTRTINVKIPAGRQYRQPHPPFFPGRGRSGGGPAGDLYVELQVAPHEIFRREGDDLEVVVKIPMTAAALGTEVTVSNSGGRPSRTRRLETKAVRVGVPFRDAVRDTHRHRRQGCPEAAGKWARPARSHPARPDSDADRRRTAGSVAPASRVRDETRPEVTVQKHSRGVFGRLRDAFAGQ